MCRRLYPACSVWFCARQYTGILTQPTFEAGFYPEGTAASILKDSGSRSRKSVVELFLHLLVAGHCQGKHRGVDVGVVLDWKTVQEGQQRQ
ncbi:hypothetical protein KCP76_26075 (plasmid) [Salmonella enterica subsp. enterica serovar Weltevreden]|nr:hypothetical protein KCP76_26075 [Salmonella enterica subsp. enterica serovar Weltevreden]QUI99507.1 hypothetical protein KCP74_25510 [Salmonella enterica subsp. enterica]QUJ01276.1 hypothetical protein KCP73_26820 [Salmonella enterica subsp. enterica]